MLTPENFGSFSGMAASAARQFPFRLRFFNGPPAANTLPPISDAVSPSRLLHGAPHRMNNANNDPGHRASLPCPSGPFCSGPTDSTLGALNSNVDNLTDQTAPLRYCFHFRGPGRETAEKTPSGPDLRAAVIINKPIANANANQHCQQFGGRLPSTAICQRVAKFTLLQYLRSSTQDMPLLIVQPISSG